jgi:hypothetical protein
MEDASGAAQRRGGASLPSPPRPLRVRLAAAAQDEGTDGEGGEGAVGGAAPLVHASSIVELLTPSDAGDGGGAAASLAGGAGGSSSDGAIVLDASPRFEGEGSSPLLVEGDGAPRGWGGADGQSGVPPAAAAAAAAPTAPLPFSLRLAPRGSGSGAALLAAALRAWMLRVGRNPPPWTVRALVAWCGAALGAPPASAGAAGEEAAEGAEGALARLHPPRGIEAAVLLLRALAR